MRALRFLATMFMEKILEAGTARIALAYLAMFGNFLSFWAHHAKGSSLKGI
jgi:hypothetical protein